MCSSPHLSRGGVVDDASGSKSLNLMSHSIRFSPTKTFTHTHVFLHHVQKDKALVADSRDKMLLDASSSIEVPLTTPSSAFSSRAVNVEVLSSENFYEACVR